MTLLPSCSEKDRNYGAVDIDELYTKKPYVRCNGDIIKLPRSHNVTTIIDDKEEKWDVYALMRFKVLHQTVCMECAGNSRKALPYKVEGLQWDNRGVSNVLWSGVLLKEILHKIPKDAKEIVFTSMDYEFTRSLPIQVINERPVMLAYLMNYQHIPAEHGGPIRLIVPGWYGMASVKWLNRIYFIADRFEGPYQTEKYTYKVNDMKAPVTVALPKSLITSAKTQNPVTISGKAWSGYPIDKVEISVNDEWMEAKITDRTGDYGWVQWEKTVELENGIWKTHKVGSRATDTSGAIQPEKSGYNYYGYANNAIQYIEIKV